MTYNMKSQKSTARITYSRKSFVRERKYSISSRESFVLAGIHFFLWNLNKSHAFVLYYLIFIFCDLIATGEIRSRKILNNTGVWRSIRYQVKVDVSISILMFRILLLNIHVRITLCPSRVVVFFCSICIWVIPLVSLINHPNWILLYWIFLYTKETIVFSFERFSNKAVTNL